MLEAGRVLIEETLLAAMFRICDEIRTCQVLVNKTPKLSECSWNEALALVYDVVQSKNTKVAIHFALVTAIGCGLGPFARP